MTRNMVARWRLFRRVIDDGRRRGSCFCNYSYHNRAETFLPGTSSSLLKFPFSSLDTSRPYAPGFHFSSLPFQHRRSLCSASDPTNIISIKSEDQFNSSLSKAQAESLPAIFYFTAVWCGPCRFISPVIKELSESHPHVTIYKVDIDQEGLESTLTDLNITSVPRLQFFHKGKKAAEIIGADVVGIKNTMEKLYK